MIWARSRRMSARWWGGTPTIVNFGSMEFPVMKRRDFLAGSAGLSLAAPAVWAAGNAKVLKFVPQADNALLGPHFSSALVPSNYANMLYDQLFGVAAAARPRPEREAGHVIEDDGKTWKITL